MRRSWRNRTDRGSAARNGGARGVRFGRSRFVLLAVGVAAGLLAGGAAGVYTWQHNAFLDWVAEGSAGLEPYPVAVYTEDGTTKPGDPRDALLVEELGRDRLLVEMTRSDYREDFWGDGCWVKVHMATEALNEDRSPVPIKLLVRIEPGEDGLRLVQQRELALP